MMHNMGSLYDELHKALLDINKQIDAIKGTIGAYTEYDEETEKYVVKALDPYGQRDDDGKFILSDVLAAKAQILSGMAALKAADVASRNVPPRSRR